jgi:hypothetical protein
VPLHDKRQSTSDEETLKPIRELLDEVRERLDTAVTRLKSFVLSPFFRFRNSHPDFRISCVPALAREREWVIRDESLRAPKCRDPKFVLAA